MSISETMNEHTAADLARSELVGERRGRERVVERRLRAEAVNIPLSVIEIDEKKSRGRRR